MLIMRHGHAQVNKTNYYLALLKRGNYPVGFVIGGTGRGPMISSLISRRFWSIASPIVGQTSPRQLSRAARLQGLYLTAARQVEPRP